MLGDLITVYDQVPKYEKKFVAYSCLYESDKSCVGIIRVAASSQILELSVQVPVKL